MRLAIPAWAKRPAVLALILAAWTALAYAPALRGPFFFDDEMFIQRNRLVHTPAELPRLYTTSVNEGEALKGGFYRPNQQLCYMLLESVFGERSTVPFHLLSVLLHALNGILLMAWLLALGLAVPAAFVGALVFLLHPAQTEAVAYISGLSDPLGLACMLTALLLYTRTLEADEPGRLWRRLPLIALLAVLAVLSKENGVVLAPLVLLVTCYGWRVGWRGTWKPAVATVAAVGMVALAYSLFKVRSLSSGIGLALEHNSYTESVLLRLATFTTDLADYARLVAFPRDLFYEKPYTAFNSLATAKGAFGLAALAAAAVTGVYGAFRAPRLALAVGIVVAGFLPYMGLVPLNAMWLEHWVYVPMLGLALLVALLAERVGQGGRGLRAGAALAFVGILGLCSWRTAARAAEWADPGAFYRNELEHGGATARILNNLGMWYADHGDLDQAIKYYEMAVDRGMRFPQPHHNLARVYLAAGRLPDAMAQLRSVIQIDPGFTYSLELLREIYKAQGDQPHATVAEAARAAAAGGGRVDGSALEAALFGDLPAKR